MTDRSYEFFKISALLDEELPAEQALEIKKQILICDRCRKEFEELKKIDSLLCDWDSKTNGSIKASELYIDKLFKRMQCKKNRTLASLVEHLRSHQTSHS
ncbi:MAG: hypothetical protein U9P14_08445 [Gemmatimonadota bacterium]|nr:hypothetical protein [Gemmatimonadota bacterium]